MLTQNAYKEIYVGTPTYELCNRNKAIDMTKMIDSQSKFV